MASQRKRAGPFRDSDSEDQDLSSTQSSARKRRRGNTGSPIVSSPVSGSERQSPPTTPPSDDEDDSEANEALYQATQHRGTRRAEDNEAAEYGVLTSVHVTNFMCHQNEKWDLSPHINFCCGKNGSGKSAILTAIVLCLGGKAAATNRGSALKDFIRHGASSASVTCSVKNQGPNAFKHDEYGDIISVERSWTATSSGFKIKNANGKSMSNKKGDLDEILDHFCLQMENPLNVLSQDNARSFISTSNAANKYKFFLKGVLLEQLDQDYAVIEDVVNSMAPKLERGDEDVSEKKRQWVAADRKLKDSLAQEGLRTRIDELRHQCIWAQVQEAESSRDQIKAEADTLDQKIAAENDRADACSMRIDEARAEAEALKADLTAANNRLDEAKSEKNEVAQKAKETLAELREQQQEKKSIGDTLKQHRREAIAAKKAFQDEEVRLAELDGGGATRRLEELNRLRTAAEVAAEASKNHRELKSELVQKSEAAKVAVGKAQEDYDAQKSRYEDRKNELGRAQRQDSSQDSKFHPQMPKLLAAMEKTNWHERPVGPVGRHIKLLHPDWSYLLETVFGGMLSGFIVSHKADQAALLNMAERLNIKGLRVITTSKHPLDLRAKEPDESFLTILRAIEVDHPQVLKALIIQNKIESAILISDFSEAQRVMNQTQANQRAQNVQSCFTFSKENKRLGFRLHFTNGLPAQDSVHEYRGFPRMNTNMDEQIRRLQETVLEEEGKVRERHSHLTVCKKASQEAEQQLKRWTRDEAMLRAEKQTADQRVEDKESEIAADRVAEGALDQLGENLEKAEKDVTTTSDLFQDGQIAVDKAQVANDAADAAVADAGAKVNMVQEEVDAARLAAQKADKNVAAIVSERNGMANKINDLEESKREYAKNLREADEDVAEWTRQAEGQGSARIAIPEGETYDTLDAKFVSMMEQLQRSEQRVGGSLEVIQARAEAALAAYDTAKKDYAGLNAIRDGLVASIRERRRRWGIFRSMIGRAARSAFIMLLSERGFRGKLILDHTQHLLDLRVEPDITKRDGAGRNARTLSGGEKSYSQICLLLALWEAMGSPVRCLDEFDVFMDAVNRNMSVNLLIEAARQSQKQFLFISPGLKSDIKAAPDVHAFEVAPPERGQQRLTFQRVQAV